MPQKSKSSDSTAEEGRKAKREARQAKIEARKAKAEAIKARAGRVRVKNTPLAGFMAFVREQGVVGLAIGLAIGTQANATVKSIVEGIVNPIVSFILGSGTGLMDRKWYMVGQDDSTTNYLWTLGKRQLVFSYGEVLSSLITLIAVAAVIYFVVKGLKLDKLDKPKS